MARIVPEGGFKLAPFRQPREKKESHLIFIRRLPCPCCLVGGVYRRADDAAHVRAASSFHGKQPTGMSEKPHDRFTLPLCRGHHDEQHAGAELVFWSRYGIDPFLLALVLWGLTGNDYAATEAIREHARNPRPIV